MVRAIFSLFGVVEISNLYNGDFQGPTRFSPHNAFADIFFQIKLTWIKSLKRKREIQIKNERLRDGINLI